MLAALASSPATKALDPDPFPRHSLRHAVYAALLYFGFETAREMTLIEMQNRSATVVAESPTVLYELTAGNLHKFYKADVYAYAMVMQNINRELCRRLRRADNSIVDLAMQSSERGHNT